MLLLLLVLAMSNSASFSSAARLLHLWLWWRGRREPGYRRDWPERLGLGRPPASTGRLWIHAVSLGETRAAAALIDALRLARPGLRLLLTHGTATGRQAGAALLREAQAARAAGDQGDGRTGHGVRGRGIGRLEVWPTGEP